MNWSPSIYFEREHCVAVLYKGWESGSPVFGAAGGSLLPVSSQVVPVDSMSALTGLCLFLCIPRYNDNALEV